MVHESRLNSEYEKLPIHIAIVTSGKTIWKTEKALSFDKAYKKSFSIIKKVIESQVSLGIPIISFHLLSTDLKSQEQFSILIDNLTDFFDNLTVDKFIRDNSIKVSILGKWYDLPGRFVESIKQVIDNTKENNKFIVNFCLNYDGQEEILDAMKLLARQIKADKVHPDSVTKDMIKQNLSSSTLPPPDLILINGAKNETTGIFLWDSSHSQLYLTNKLFPEFTIEDLDNAIKEYTGTKK